MEEKKKQQKWYFNLPIKAANGDSVLRSMGLTQTGADVNCITKVLLSSKYFEESTEALMT